MPTLLLETPQSTTAKPETLEKQPRLLLVGNPNVGKSVIFGYLTGKYVTVSNYPGTTVEVSRGKFRYGGRDWEVIDTPGVNSLVPQSDDERVTRDLLLAARPDVIVQVADAKNLRRTLLLTSQLAELGVPLVLVLNLMDEARGRGIEIDIPGLQELFGIPIVPTVAIDGEGLYTLFKTIHHAAVPHDPLAASRARLLNSAEFARVPFSTAGASMPQQLTLEWLQTRDDDLRRGVEEWLQAQTPDWPIPRSDARLRSLSARLEEARNGWLEQSVARFKKAAPSVLASAESKTFPFVFAALGLGLLLFLYTELGRLFGWLTPYGWLNAQLESGVLPAAQSWLAGHHLGTLGTVLFGQFNAESQAYENGFLYPLLPQLLLLIAPVLVPLALCLRRSRSFAERLGHWSRDWRTGAPVLLAVLLLMYEFVRRHRRGHAGRCAGKQSVQHPLNAALAGLDSARPDL